MNPPQGYPPQTGLPQYQQPSPQVPQQISPYGTAPQQIYPQPSQYPPQQGYPQQPFGAPHYPPQGYPPQPYGVPPQSYGSSNHLLSSPQSPQQHQQVPYQTSPQAYPPQQPYAGPIQQPYSAPPQSYGSSNHLVSSPQSPPPQKTGILSTIKNIVHTALPGGCGKLQLFLDKPSYMAGDIVTGRADLTVTDNIHARTLMIKWRGFERTKMSHTETYVVNNQTQLRTVWHHENRDFFKQEAVLHNFGNNIVTPGNYSFNFQYQLPHNLPGVFSKKGNGFLAAIMYKVKVWVDMKGFDIKMHSHITINESCAKIPQPINVQNEKSFLFGGSGKLHMIINLPKDVYAPGEHVTIKCNINNESKKDVGKLKAKLMQDISVTCRGRHHSEKNEIQRAVFPGVKSRTTFQGDLVFDLPVNIFPSSHGTLIKNQYHLDIECDVAMAFDLEVHPKITIALPNTGSYVPLNMYDSFHKGCWKI